MSSTELASSDAPGPSSQGMWLVTGMAKVQLSKPLVIVSALQTLRVARATPLPSLFLHVHGCATGLTIIPHHFAHCL